MDEGSRQRESRWRWHDNRHTLVTELAKSGAGDEVIMSIAGHVSRAVLSRYSHVRMEAKRRALDEIAAHPRGICPVVQPSEMLRTWQGICGIDLANGRRPLSGQNNEQGHERKTDFRK